jgi:hypothetical protein
MHSLWKLLDVPLIKVAQTGFQVKVQDPLPIILLPLGPHETTPPGGIEPVVMVETDTD